MIQKEKHRMKEKKAQMNLQKGKCVKIAMISIIQYNNIRSDK